MPLSPLLYLIIANALSTLISKETEGGISGVPIEETCEQYTHGQFMDDTSLIVEAKRGVPVRVLHIFRVMGDASGLYINEGNIKAVLVSVEP